MCHVCGFICYLCVELKLMINTRSLSNQALKSAQTSLLSSRCWPWGVFIGAGQPLQHGEVRDTNLAWVRSVVWNAVRCPTWQWWLDCLLLDIQDWTFKRGLQHSVHGKLTACHMTRFFFSQNPINIKYDLHTKLTRLPPIIKGSVFGG